MEGITATTRQGKGHRDSPYMSFTLFSLQTYYSKQGSESQII